MWIGARRNGQQTGFTLIELILVVGIASIVGSTFFGVVYWQNVMFWERLDEVDAHQTARASVNLIRRYARSARFGLADDPQAIGIVGIGQCYNTQSPASAKNNTQTNCTNLASDNNNSRLRFVSMIADEDFVSATTQPSAGPCPGSVGVSNPMAVALTKSPVTPYISGNTALIGGTCANGNVANDLVIVTADQGAGNGCAAQIGFTMFDTSASLSCGVGQGYNPGFTFGRAQIVDFYTGTDPNVGVPALFLRIRPRLPLSSAFVVAYDVTEMHVVYGIDTTTPVDRRLDACPTCTDDPGIFSGLGTFSWCADPRASDLGGPCNLSDSQGNVLSSQNISNRIVALWVRLVVRTPQPRPTFLGGVIGTGGYRYWTYDTTISLRNAAL